MPHLFGVVPCRAYAVGVNGGALSLLPFAMFQLKAGVRACLCAWGVVGSALAQTALPPTVVVANRAEQPLTDVLADVSIIDRATLEASGAAGVADVLATLPGIEIARNGGVGNTTSVFIRGAESRFVAVFIDGVRVDTQSGSGGATWNAIPLALIERIEVVRGPAAAVYGSDALAGVVQIFTRRGEGGWRPSMEVGAGSDGLRRVQASVAGRQGDWDAAVAVHGERSDGFNVQPAANPDRDGYRSHGVSASVGWAVSRGHRLEATVVDQRLKAEFDESSAEDWAIHDLRTVGLRWTAQWSAEQRSELALGRGTDRYESRSLWPYAAETDVTTALWRHEWLLGAHRWQVLLERREDDLRDTYVTVGRVQRHQNGVGLGWGWGAGNHAVQVNVRHDEDSEFGGETTGSAAYAWRFAPGWKARAGVSTAFRAPTLFQRYSKWGSAGLQPERAHGAEAALEYERDGWRAAVIAYHTRVRNLIDWTGGYSCMTNCYQNIDRARLRGVSLRGGMPVGMGRVEASVDWSDPENAITGKRLSRRAARSAKLQWSQSVASGRLGVEWQVAGERFDDWANMWLGGYGVVNLSWRQPVARDWTLLARVDNLGDKAYETARGYATGGRQVYVGLSWTPR